MSGGQEVTKQRLAKASCALPGRRGEKHQRLDPFCTRGQSQAPGTHLLAGRLGGEGGTRGGAWGALAALILSPHLELVGGGCARAVAEGAG